jgi:hypothetical protein
VRRALLLASIALAAACGGRVQGDSAVDASPILDAGPDTLVDFDTFTPPDVGGVEDVGGVGDVGEETGCTVDPTPLAKLFTGSSCTALVRLDHVAKFIVGWNVSCGDPKSTSEVDARAAFAPYVAPYTKIDEYVTVGGGAPPDEYIFFRSAGDFGGVGFVSVVRGDVLFAAELAWMGPTKVDLPSPMRSNHELDGLCPGFGKPFDLAPERRLTIEGGSIDDVSPVLNRLELTLLAPAITRAGHAIVNVLITDLPLGDASTPSNDWLAFVNTALILD